jgi:hypothetical protein
MTYVPVEQVARRSTCALYQAVMRSHTTGQNYVWRIGGVGITLRLAWAKLKRTLKT